MGRLLDVLVGSYRQWTHEGFPLVLPDKLRGGSLTQEE